MTDKEMERCSSAVILSDMEIFVFPELMHSLVLANIMSPRIWLDKYDAETIPYWKTETVEAMDAFRHRTGFETGAGECVPLAALYAAALFVICRIRLKDIYMMATPAALAELC
ncbi:MAG: hypothetical protein WC340_06845 [Kiritimatiellia bacterium]